MTYAIPVELTTTPKTKPSHYKQAFGTVFTDHMFILDYDA
ncbi:branched chain amino acid aminotransferase, partial [Clostridium perfringens]